MSINLSHDEIAEITGRVYSKPQCKWLREHGFIYHLSGDGSPIVARAHYLQKMGVDLKKNSSNDEDQPNFDE